MSNNPSRSISSRILRDFFGVSLSTIDLRESQEAPETQGFFRYGPDIVCFGKSSGGVSSDISLAGRYDASHDVRVTPAGVSVPFDFAAVIDNLRRERYIEHIRRGRQAFGRSHRLRRTYYAIRNRLPDGIRRRIQKSYFKDWRKIPFPQWPVDFTADSLHEEFLKLTMKVQGLNRIPFIWFWPEGASACAIVTHDVENAAARDFSSKIMDLDGSYGFRSSFQVVPEGKYHVPLGYWNEIRSRGFEFNIHDLNHDGHLFHDKKEFERRAKLINGYARSYEARGFRSRGMYRNLDWFDAFEFSYDMSVPNVAHLERQRGGCCTVMPFFVRNILEIPLTTSQDYSLFDTLGEYSIDLWKKQIAIILKRNGLISFSAHPDHLIDLKPRGVYDALLAYLRKTCDRQRVWHALPAELDRWWRARAKMRVVNGSEGWRIEGPESDRARIAYANLDGHRLVYTIEESPAPQSGLADTGQESSDEAVPTMKDAAIGRKEVTNIAVNAPSLRARRLP